MMKREQFVSIGIGVVIALQSWILIEIVTLRDRVTRVETKLEYTIDR